MAEKARAHVFVDGLVQGVFFRQNTLHKAKELGVFGFVKNLPDGKVEAVFEGGKDKVREIIDWTNEGPDHANVNNQEISWEEYKGEFDNFEIRF